MHPTVPPRTCAPWSSSIGIDGRHASEPVVFFVGMPTQAFADVLVYRIENASRHRSPQIPPVPILSIGWNAMRRKVKAAARLGLPGAAKRPS
jgi:hypothetical protein